MFLLSSRRTWNVNDACGLFVLVDGGVDIGTIILVLPFLKLWPSDMSHQVESTPGRSWSIH